MPQRVEKYRLNAEKCLEAAKNFNDPKAKRTMFAMAIAWTTLAAQRFKNIAVGNSPSPQRSNISPPDDDAAR